MNYFDLTGQVAVVTGCSTGLGVQMAKALASQGAKIVALARRKEKIDAVAAEIAQTYHVETLALPCDITDTARVDAVIDEVVAKWGRYSHQQCRHRRSRSRRRHHRRAIQRRNERGFIRHVQGGACCRKKGNDWRKIWAHYQYRVDVRVGRQQDCRKRTVSRSKGRGGQLDARTGGRMGQIRHHRELHLPGLFLYAAHKRNARFRLFPAKCPHDDSNGTIRQRRRT